MDQLLTEIDLFGRIGREESVIDRLWFDLLEELEATFDRQGGWKGE
jgi:hypothetical protein